MARLIDYNVVGCNSMCRHHMFILILSCSAESTMIQFLFIFCFLLYNQRENNPTGNQRSFVFCALLQVFFRPTL